MDVRAADFAAACFTETVRQTDDPTAHRVVLTLLEDDVDHGSAGWSYLASRRDDEVAMRALADRLPAIVERSVSPVFAQRERDASEAKLLARRGFVSAADSQQIVRATLRDAVIRGFREAGVDVDETYRMAVSRGWIVD